MAFALIQATGMIWPQCCDACGTFSAVHVNNSVNEAEMKML